MNPLNYASFEASQRLVDAGIVLETEAAWCEYTEYWGLGYRGLIEDDPRKRPLIPAPSMAEVWRELPREWDGMILTIKKEQHYSLIGYEDKRTWVYYIKDNNPTDALIDLLIWLKGKEDKNDR